MSFLGGLLGGVGSIVGSILGGNSQQNAANTAAQAQENLTTQDLNYLQNAGAQARSAIGSLLPYITGPSQAAGALRNNLPFLAAGQGATFGGQQVQATPTGGSTNYSSLLSPQTYNQVAPNYVSNPGGGTTFTGGPSSTTPIMRYLQGSTRRALPSGG